MNEFASNVERHRRELLVHCYRMLGSLPDAEDAVQQTLLRAWQYRDSLKEGAPLRPWLYRVATNACLDAIARDERRAVLAARATADEGWTGEPEDVVWLGPIPNSVLEPTTPPARTPEAMTLMRETIERGRAGRQRPWRTSPARRTVSTQRPSRKQCIAARAGQAPRASAVAQAGMARERGCQRSRARSAEEICRGEAKRRTFAPSHRSSARTRPSACRPSRAWPKAVKRCSSYGPKADSAPNDLVASAAF